ncbi:hypothetical protein LUZ60_011000 [Juncus effusus]|nr:hypothetical protein LUZ60_011000 [Juncus effusus]
MYKLAQHFSPPPQRRTTEKNPSEREREKVKAADREISEMPSSCPRPYPQQLHRIHDGAPTRISLSTTTTARCTAHEVPATVSRHHEHFIGPNQCCSAVVQTISAPVNSVWSVIRQFDKPQTYKHFIRSCHVINGDGDVGTVREVHVVSGLPATSSRERLEILDDECHVISFSVVGGEHRLKNYRSVTTLHEEEMEFGKERTVVVESYVVDIPHGNTREETCVFIDTIVKCNLQSLSRTAEQLANGDQLNG